MARRTTKKKDLTPEEKLAQALVPVEEQPYRVPGNWCWVRLGSLVTILNGYAFKSKNYCSEGIRIIRIANVQDGYIVDDKPAFYPIDYAKQVENFMLVENDLLISLTGNVGRVAFTTVDLLPAALNQRVGCLRICESVPLLKLFLFDYFLRSEFQDSCIKNSKGSAQLNMSTEWLKEQAIPLPPFPEQQRIVARIESLFAKLDEAKEKAQAVVDGFEERKAAILHKAFTGELTKRWREERGIESQCEYVTVDSVCKSLKYGTARKSVPKGSVVVLRMGNLQQGEIDWTNLVYSTDEDDNQKYRLSAGDVLFNRTNSPELVGKTSIYRGEYPAIYAGYLIKLDYDHSILEGEYLNYILNTPEAKEYCNRVKTDGVNQSNINAKKIGAFSFPLPSLTEQQQIISTLHDLLDKQQQAKSAAEQVLDQIDTMKKAILARAFRGELGTNDPQEESAVELVRRALDE